MSGFSRLLAVFLLVLGVAAGVWFWRGLHLKHSFSGDDDGIPTRLWSEIKAADTAFADSPYEPAQVAGTILDSELNEISGITSSRRATDLYWVHNDSGDRPRIFAVTSGGKVRGEFRVTGAINQDWEDIAAGPGRDDRPALYIGDIGDNARRRSSIVVYRVPEPVVSGNTANADTEPAEPFEFIYPDGRHDAEALIVDPASGRIYIITKTGSGRCGLYRSPLPLQFGAPMTLERVDGAERISELRYVTGADASFDGLRVIIRTYFSAFELVREKGREFEDIFRYAPVPVALPLEPQGEAITYSADGNALLTTSEKIPARIHRLNRRKP
ncbi:MAG: hypothetical protein KF868_16100 [Acidobacteria bacterium]|nr:hypothetical protein [Acidobacteriota bacterium]MCW5970117.1 hypothetical protein [Blastocatellales bacterium]